MHYSEETEKRKDQSRVDKQRLILDGTANLDYAEGEEIPRVKGLIELLNQYFGKKNKNLPGNNP